MFLYFVALLSLTSMSEALFGGSDCPTGTDNLGRNVCAVLYDDEGCDGWDYQVRNFLR